MRRFTLAAVVLLAACDRLFLSENDAPPDAPPIDAPPPCFREPFTTSFDPRWHIVNPASPATVAISTGELEITLPPNAVTANALQLDGEDLREGSVEVELAAAPAPSTATGAQFFVQDRAGGKYYMFYTYNGQLATHVDPLTDTSMPYSPTTHRWLRIRHVGLTQQIVFETAPADKVWVGLRTVSATHQVADVSIALGAAESAATPAPGFASFDDVVIRKPTCSSPP